MNSKLKTLPQLKALIRKFKKQRKKIVFTNGCFDILHAGHVSYLTQAKRFGDILVLGLNSDASVRKIKGPSRPLNSEKDRAAVLAGLEAIDLIVIFNEPTPASLIRALEPDVLVKGSDWKLQDIAGAKEVILAGGKVRRIPLVKGRSTSNILKRLEVG